VRIIQLQLNCTTDAEFYRLLGFLIVVQKLLNDYLSKVKEEISEPENFAEEWMEEFELDSEAKDEVLNMFLCALLAIGRSENNG